MTPAPPRNHAIDVARALAVTGVVINHSIDGLVGSGIIDPASRVAEINGMLYIFRMPALALLLGLFIPRAVTKRGAAGYVRERVTLAVYLYVLWFFIQTSVEIATSSMKNTPRGVSDLLQIWTMPAHLWFLPYLAVSALVITFAAPWVTRRRAIVVLVVLAGVALATWDWNPLLFGLRGFSLLLFTALGAAIGMGRLGRALNGPLWIWGALGLVAAAGFAVLWHMGMSPGTAGSSKLPLDTVAVSIAGALLGIVVLLAMAAALAHVSVIRRIVGYVGEHTLEVYLAHVIVTAGTRIVLARLGFESEGLFLIVVVSAGVIAPLALAYVAPRVGCRWLFQPPGPLARWSKAASSEVKTPAAL